jgi:hypothetical protein
MRAAWLLTLLLCVSCVHGTSVFAALASCNTTTACDTAVANVLASSFGAPTNASAVAAAMFPAIGAQLDALSLCSEEGCAAPLKASLRPLTLQYLDVNETRGSLVTQYNALKATLRNCTAPLCSSASENLALVSWKLRDTTERQVQFLPSLTGFCSFPECLASVGSQISLLNARTFQYGQTLVTMVSFSNYIWLCSVTGTCDGEMVVMWNALFQVALAQVPPQGNASLLTPLSSVTLEFVSLQARTVMQLADGLSSFNVLGPVCFAAFAVDGLPKTGLSASVYGRFVSSLLNFWNSTFVTGTNIPAALVQSCDTADCVSALQNVSNQIKSSNTLARDVYFSYYSQIPSYGNFVPAILWFEVVVILLLVTVGIFCAILYCVWKLAQFEPLLYTVNLLVVLAALCWLQEYAASAYLLYTPNPVPVTPNIFLQSTGMLSLFGDVILAVAFLLLFYIFLLAYVEGILQRVVPTIVKLVYWGIAVAFVVIFWVKFILEQSNPFGGNAAVVNISIFIRLGAEFICLVCACTMLVICLKIKSLPMKNSGLLSSERGSALVRMMLLLAFISVSLAFNFCLDAYYIFGPNWPSIALFFASRSLFRLVASFSLYVLIFFRFLGMRGRTNVAELEEPLLNREKTPNQYNI